MQKKIWALHVLVHFKILFHLPPLIIFENNALESGHLLLLGLAMSCVSLRSPPQEEG